MLGQLAFSHCCFPVLPEESSLWSHDEINARNSRKPTMRPFFMDDLSGGPLSSDALV